MSDSEARDGGAAAADLLGALAAWPSVWTQALCAIQQTQFATLDAMQHALASIGQELFDEWVVHWAGGAPLDG